jgi:hypothetical protein
MWSMTKRMSANRLAVSFSSGVAPARRALPTTIEVNRDSRRAAVKITGTT